MSVKEAVNQAADDCIAANILADFLRAHRAEVLRVYLAEANEEVLRKNLKAEGYDEGYNDGNQNHLIQLITKKIKAGKPLEQIAAEVEEPIESITELYKKILTEFEQNKE